MDFDTNLLLNFIPVISVTTITIVTFITLVCKLRNRWPVKVHCWFCNGITKVSRKSLDWWFCSHCEQYNGFSEDGDYNYEIPEQYRLAKKSNDKSNSYCQRKEFLKHQSSLCNDCNRKEELKLSKLRELENSNDEFNSKKINRFEKRFDKKYPLCLKCQNTVQNVLYKQTLWLTQYKMLLFKQRPIKNIIKNREKIEVILRIVLSILAFVTVYFIEVWYLPLCGIFLQIAAYMASPVNKRQSNVGPTLGWICLIWVKTFSLPTVLKMFNIYMNNDWTPVNSDNTYYYFIITLGTTISFANLKFQSYKSISNRNLTFKKLEIPNTSISESHSRTPSPDITPPSEESSFNENEIRNFHSPVNITDNLMTPSAFETPIPLKPTTFTNWLNCENKNYLPSHFSSKASVFNNDTEKSFYKVPSNQTLNDSLSSLNSLSLGSNKKISPTQSSGIFETKIYGTTSPVIFNKQHRYNTKRNILAPPKLRSVTQSSWVAGGYWQSGLDMPTLSRSSSQSSGFGSSASNYGASREPSIHEFDQCSVLSEQGYFTRPESPLSLQNSAITKRKSNKCSPRCSQINEKGYDNSSLQYHIRNDTQCSGHTTIVTNPVWVPILLCGSLLFNMVVLFTMLLR